MNKLLSALSDKIKKTYEEGVTVEDAEKLAAEFLHAQMQVSSELRIEDLDARMRRSGLKAMKAAVYTDAISKAEKKPTEAQLEHIVNIDKLVNGEQEGLDTAEVRRDDLERHYSIFREAHIYFRGIAKGRFD